jgi:hypothetical protein
MRTIVCCRFLPGAVPFAALTRLTTRPITSRIVSCKDNIDKESVLTNLNQSLIHTHTQQHQHAPNTQICRPFFSSSSLCYLSRRLKPLYVSSLCVRAHFNVVYAPCSLFCTHLTSWFPCSSLLAAQRLLPRSKMPRSGSRSRSSARSGASANAGSHECEYIASFCFLSRRHRLNI